MYGQGDQGFQAPHGFGNPHQSQQYAGGFQQPQYGSYYHQPEGQGGLQHQYHNNPYQYAQQPNSFGQQAYGNQGFGQQ